MIPVPHSQPPENREEVSIVSISTDLTTRDMVVWRIINQTGDGFFIRPGHELDENTDIYITSLSRRTVSEMQGRFAGVIVYIVENEYAIVPDGDRKTTLDRLPWTLRAIAREIGHERIKK